MQTLLNWFFNTIKPRRGRNWLSMRFYRWESKKMEEENRKWLEFRKDKYEFFKAPGAGIIALSCDTHFTGGAAGLSIGVSWGEFGYCGGVLGYTEAKKMAEYILMKCNEQEKSEEEILFDWRERWNKKINEIKQEYPRLNQ